MLEKLIGDLVSAEDTPCYTITYRSFDVDSQSLLHRVSKFSSYVLPLCFASAFGLIGNARDFIRKPADLNETVPGSRYSYVLAVASAKRRLDMVDLLLRSGADVNLCAVATGLVQYCIALVEACTKGLLGVVWMLLKSGAYTIFK